LNQIKLLIETNPKLAKQKINQLMDDISRTTLVNEHPNYQQAKRILHD